MELLVKITEAMKVVTVNVSVDVCANEKFHQVSSH